jgi:drug/metabolite transporter (DMT)-like permease
VAGVAWGGQFPVAGSALRLIDPFSFTVARYAAVSLLLVLLLLAAEGRRALALEGRGGRVWAYGTLAFTVYNFLVFLGQKTAGPSGAVLAAVMMALMPMISVLVVWARARTTPGAVTLGCVAAAFTGVALVVTRGDPGVLASAGGNLVPALLMLAGVVGWVVYTIGGGDFPWSPLRYTTLACCLGTATALGIVLAATLAGVLEAPGFTALSAIRWEMAYMIAVSGVVAQLAWNAGNRALAPINGILFINLVPVTTLGIALLAGHAVSLPEAAGAALTIAALVANNLHQRRRLRGARAYDAASRASRARLRSTPQR